MIGVSETPVRVELFTRAGAVGTYDRVTEATDWIRELDARDEVTECTVTTWDKHVALDNGRPGRSEEVLAKVEEFESWARERDASLYPFFEERTRGSLATDGEQRVIVLPVLCLAVYEAGALRELFPHAVDDVSYTVHEGLAALETDRGGFVLHESNERQ